MFFSLDLRKIFRFFFLATLPFILIKTQQTPLVSYWFDRPFAFLLAQSQSLLSSTLDGLHKAYRDYVYLVDLRQENVRLQQELAELRALLADYRNLKQELSELQALMGLKAQSPIEWVAAEVISSVKDILGENFWINKGSSDGISTGQAVVSRDAIVGSIIRTLPHQSQVLLLSDRFSVIDVKIERNNVKGLLEGLGNRSAIFKAFENPHDVLVGDILVSAGTDQVFPRGILVGTISEIVLDPETGLNFAKVNLAFQHFALDYLFVATTRSPADHSFWKR